MSLEDVQIGDRVRYLWQPIEGVVEGLDEVNDRLRVYVKWDGRKGRRYYSLEDLAPPWTGLDVMLDLL